VLGGLLAVLLFGSFSLSEALILGVILAPTDPGVGSAVVTDPRLPQVVRQSLNVEGGLNDGICVPLTTPGGRSSRWPRRGSPTGSRSTSGAAR